MKKKNSRCGKKSKKGKKRYIFMKNFERQREERKYNKYIHKGRRK